MERLLAELDDAGERRRLLVVAVLFALLIPSEIVYFGHRPASWAIVDTLTPAAWLVAGLVAWRKRPANPAGLLMVAFGLSWLANTYRWAEGFVPASALGWLFGAGIHAAFLAHLLLVFPGVRLERQFDRALLGAVWLQVTVLYWVHLLFYDPAGDGCGDCAAGSNPFAVLPDPGTADATASVLTTVNYLSAAVVLARVVLRWRAASAVARRAMGPVLATGAVTLAMLIAFIVGAIPFPVYGAFVVLVPLGFLTGVVRTRVTRSVVGELVTELAEMPTPDRLRELLARALGDPSLELGFWAEDRQAYVDGSGRPLPLPPDPQLTRIDVGGRPQAVLLHDPALRDDDGLLEAVGAAARLAIQNARLQAEVRAQLEEVRESRERIVAAGDAERRRIERDLHDGAQQRLVSLALSLRLLQGELGDAADPRVEALLDQASAEAQGAIEELRELARGIHPAVLVDAGLGPALEGLARRSTIPVVLDAVPSERLPTAIEVAAYFTCSECLVNVTKHAHASAVHIAAREADGDLVVEVADDGIGGAYVGAGSGLAGLRDRVEALGGTLEVVSAPGRGTRVTARLRIVRDRAPVS